MPCIGCDNPPAWVRSDRDAEWLFDEDRTFHLLAHLVDEDNVEEVDRMIELAHLVAHHLVVRAIEHYY